MALLKRIFNQSEKNTHEKLCTVCGRWGADVFAKVRVADILSLESLGLPSDLFRFALQAHFDFVVAVDEYPQFAVEFDGPSHQSSLQIARDDKKNELCRLTEFPLLRVNSRWLDAKYRQMDLLTWLTDAWFLEKGFYDAQEKGIIPQDEPFDPTWLIISTSDPKRLWPMQLSLEGREAIRKLFEKGHCVDPVPSYVIGMDDRQNLKALAWIRVTDQKGVFAKTGMRSQLFQANLHDALEEIISCELSDKVISALSGKEQLIELVQIERSISDFRANCTMLRASGCGNMLLLSTFIK